MTIDKERISAEDIEGEVQASRTARRDVFRALAETSYKTSYIVLANALEADGFLTDEFGGTNFALVHAVLTGPRIIPTPRLICDYARNDHMSFEEARTLIESISPHRSWENSPYVAQLLNLLE